jgi:exodeoxyribonuclease VII large subunit
MSPENVLKRGYSITLLNGKSVKNAEAVKTGDILHTTLFQGNIKSVVENE